MCKLSRSFANSSSENEGYSAVNTTYKLFRMIYSPTRAFLDLLERPQWFVAFLVISLAQSIPMLVPLFRHGIRSFSYDNPTLWLQLSPALLIPVSTLISWTIVAFSLHQLVILTCPEVASLRFKNVFSIVAHSNIVLLLSSVLSLLLGFLLWLSNAAPTIHAIPLVGVDKLLQNFSLDPLLLSLFQKINIFTVWYLGLLIIGLSIHAGIPKTKSAALTIVVWLFWRIIQIGYRSIFLDLVKER